MTALPSTEDLARLAKAITPGPWKAGRHPWPTQVGCCPLPGRPYEISHEMRNLAAANTIADAEAIALLPALIREVLDRREADRWQPIETCPPGDGPVLIYYPDMESDAYYPGHPIHVSNREYVLCGNAAEYGASHWRPIPAPPTTEASHGE